MNKNGIYFDKKAGHWRVRIMSKGIQEHLGTTKEDKLVACAMYDFFIHLEGLQSTHPLNFFNRTMREVHDLILEKDPRALQQVMDKSSYRLVKNDNQKVGGLS